MDPFSIAAIGSGVFSALSARKGQQDANEQNRQMSREQMDFQERMSNTAHQREVADLRAAGLNPLLSLNSGASSPSGSMATSENVNKDVGNNFVNSARVAMERELNKSTIATQKSQQELNSANALNAIAQIPRNTAIGKIAERISRGLDAIDGATAWTAKKFGSAYVRVESRRYKD